MEKHIKNTGYFIGCMLVVGAALLIAGLTILQKEENQLTQGRERQELEEELADEYIQWIEQKNETTHFSEKEEEKMLYTPIQTKGNVLRNSLNQKDTNENLFTLWENTWQMWEEKDTSDYYIDKNGVRYTPDYAQGTLAFVLEIPSIELCRGVYGGTSEQIAHDLSIWMLTLARESYELGETAICIYGHNSIEQNLSFNRLCEITTGADIHIYSEKGIFTYKVSEIFALEREECAKQVLDNTSLSDNQLFLITCGNEAWTGKNMIVAATKQ